MSLGLTWVEKSNIDHKSLISDLRFEVVDYNSIRILNGWEVQGDKYGLPRNYARLLGFSHILSDGDNVCWPGRGPVSYRYNQEEVIKKATENLLKTGGCLIEAPCGFGKTFCGVQIAANLGRKTLVVVHKTDLISQWSRTLENLFNIKSGRIQQEKLDYSSPLNVATVQTLYSKIDDLPQSFWRAFGTVIIDESHRMPCEMFTSVVSKLPARFRLGLSATWRRKDGLEPIWRHHISNLIVCGNKNDVPVFYSVINYYGINEKNFFFRREINHSRCLNAIARDQKYNEFCAEGIRKLVQSGRNLLCVSHRIEQLESLYKMLSDMDIGIYTGKFFGKVQTRSELEAASKKNPIFGTFGKIGEGSDIPRLDSIMLLTPCTDPEQVIGRISRPYEGKKYARVFDIVIKTQYTEALARKRFKIYKSMGVKKHG